MNETPNAGMPDAGGTTSQEPRRPGLMKQAFAQLDRILRGEVTSDDMLLAGDAGTLRFGLLVPTLIALGMVYGLCMGVFALFSFDPIGWEQALASMVKVPALFVLTLLITFPSLYVFNALTGSQLSFTQILRLLLVSMAVLMTILASFGPIAAFFAVCSSSHAFMRLLNVGIFVIAGIMGMRFLCQMLTRFNTLLHVMRMNEEESETADPPAEDTDATTDRVSADAAPEGTPPALAPAPRRQPIARRHLAPNTHRKTQAIFMLWILVFSVIAAQMGWILRPLIGDPKEGFVLFAPRESNIFMGILMALADLLGVS